MRIKCPSCGYHLFDTSHTPSNEEEVRKAGIAARAYAHKKDYKWELIASKSKDFRHVVMRWEVWRHLYELGYSPKSIGAVTGHSSSNVYNACKVGFKPKRR